MDWICSGCKISQYPRNYKIDVEKGSGRVNEFPVFVLIPSFIFFEKNIIIHSLIKLVMSVMKDHFTHCTFL